MSAIQCVSSSKLLMPMRLSMAFLLIVVPSPTASSTGPGKKEDFISYCIIPLSLPSPSSLKQRLPFRVIQFKVYGHRPSFRFSR